MPKQAAVGMFEEIMTKQRLGPLRLTAKAAAALASK
jgi:hypothetical protein